jgi:hypothetical protein
LVVGRLLSLVVRLPSSVVRQKAVVGLWSSAKNLSFVVPLNQISGMSGQ